MSASASSTSILASICPPLDTKLTEQLLGEYASLERRYVLGDWEPATLDGGQFVEAAARIIYHQDANNHAPRRSVHNCLRYVENKEQQRVHHYPDRKSALHTARVLRSIHKFRSDRGAVHIDPDYTANQLDSKLVIENCRWVLAEILRVFWKADRAEVARIIRELVRYEVPVVAEFSDRLFVQRTDCTAEEEILILLHHAGEEGLSRAELGKSIPKAAATITGALQKLIAPNCREVVQLERYQYRLMDLGTQRVLRDLADKMVLPT